MTRFHISALATAIMLGGTLLSNATPLTPAQSLTRLSGSSSMRFASPVNVNDLVYTKANDSSPLLYIFAPGDNQGYVVVSADDCAPALLGFSDNGSFNIADAPPAFLEWLDDYAFQIEQIRNNPSSEVRGNINRMVKRANVAPKLTTLWNQGSPYNQDCPKVGSTATYTGCVATAMAQVMKYHNWPPKGRGSHSYEWTASDVTTTLSMDFSQQVFQWNYMTDTYSTSSTAAQKNAVAQLMHACGISVDMGYGTSSSGAVSSKVSGALINYFDYCKEAIQLQRAYIKSGQWEDYLYKSLTEYGPVYYTGRNSEGGHAFVCDGYRDGYWHFNWGWGGSSNGYFLLTAMDPSSQGIGGTSSGYNTSQTMTAFTKPMYEGSKKTLFMCFNKAITPTYTASTRVLKLAGFFFNSTPDTIQPAMGMLLTSPSGVETYVGSYNGQLAPNYGFTYYSLVLPQLTENGVYRVQPVYRDRNQEDSQWVKMYGGPGIPDYIELTVNGSTVTPNANSAKRLSAGEITLNSPIYRTQKFSLSTTLTNPNDYEMLTNVYAALWKKEGTAYTLEAYGVGQNVSIDGNASKTIEYISAFTSNTPTAGDYYISMAMLDGEDMVAISDMKEITVGSNTDQVMLTGSNFTVLNNTSVDPSLPIPLTITVKDTQGVYANYFDIYLFVGTATTSSTFCRTPFFFISPGETRELAFNVRYDASLFTKGQSCRLYIYYYRGTSRTLLANTYFTVGDIGSGVDEVASDDALRIIRDAGTATLLSSSDISSVAVYNLSGATCHTPTDYEGTAATIDLQNLQPGIYVVRVADGTGLHSIKLAIQ